MELCPGQRPRGTSPGHQHAYLHNGIQMMHNKFWHYVGKSFISPTMGIFRMLQQNSKIQRDCKPCRAGRNSPLTTLGDARNWFHCPFILKLNRLVYVHYFSKLVKDTKMPSISLKPNEAGTSTRLTFFFYLRNDRNNPFSKTLTSNCPSVE